MPSALQRASPVASPTALRGWEVASVPSFTPGTVSSEMALGWGLPRAPDEKGVLPALLAESTGPKPTLKAATACYLPWNALPHHR
jgi:hypothetical protein